MHIVRYIGNIVKSFVPNMETLILSSAITFEISDCIDRCPNNNCRLNGKYWLQLLLHAVNISILLIGSTEEPCKCLFILILRYTNFAINPWPIHSSMAQVTSMSTGEKLAKTNHPINKLYEVTTAHCPCQINKGCSDMLTVHDP